MRYMANSRIADGATPDQVTRFFDANGFSSAAWELVRHRIVVDYAVKVGEVPGAVLFMEVDSLREASDLVNGLPVVEQGLLAFDLEPIKMSVHW